MRAITRSRFGSPDILADITTAIPEPDAGEVLIEVDAAGVNPGDVLELRGWPYAARAMSYGFPRPRRAVPGADVVGRIGAVGADVDGFDVGDHIVGWSRSGAFAEFATVAIDAAVPKPPNLTDVEAAVLPTAGVAALQALRAGGPIGAGSDVLVVGASGGVGTFAVQIAKAYGATVTGVASAANADLVRGLGADAVIDYRADDFTTRRGCFDLIVDLVGNRPLRDVRRALARRGTAVVVGAPNPRSLTGMRRFAGAVALSPTGSQRLVPLFATQDGNDLAELVALAEAGSVRSVIDRTFDLAATADALHHVETGHPRGKVAITT